MECACREKTLRAENRCQKNEMKFIQKVPFMSYDFMVFEITKALTTKADLFL